MSIQGSALWLAERCGKVTASRFKDIIAKTKTGVSASRKNYMAEKVLELLTGNVAESYTNAAMEWGTATEPEARQIFEAETGFIVEEQGFILLNDSVGCSPDGFIGLDEGLEIKCPNSATHLETLLAGEMPSTHDGQVQGSLWITGRKRWHFVSYDPRFPEPLRLFHCVIERDEKYIAMLAGEVEMFVTEMLDTVKQLRSRLNG